MDHSNMTYPGDDYETRGSTDAILLKQARLVIARLERLSPDSTWARRASGHRRSLVRLVARLEATTTKIVYHANNVKDARNDQAAIFSSLDRLVLQRLLQQSFDILNKAARSRFQR